jgi:hypothetical protein
MEKYGYWSELLNTCDGDLPYSQEATMAKLDALTDARTLQNIRAKKIMDAFSDVRNSLKTQRGKLNYAIHFWLGAEGVAWFMRKNDLRANELQEQFDAEGVEAFKEREYTTELANKIATLEEKFLADLLALLATI